MPNYVAVPLIQTPAEIKRIARDPATYRLNEMRQRIGQSWRRYPMQIAVTADLSCSGIRPVIVRKVR